MAAAPTPLAELTGPIFLGFLFNWALFGALSVQVYIYYLAFPNDRIFPTKSLVLFVYVYEAIQTCIATRDGFKYFCSGWGNMAVLNEVGWIWISIPLMTGLISALTQIFYAWRIFILSDRSWYIPVFIILIALLQAGGAMASGLLANHGLWSEVVPKTAPTATIWLGGTAVCDVIIAVVMIYYLSKSRGGFQRTNALLVKLMRLTVETGFITATVAVVDLVMFLAFSHANYHLTPAICLSKLYSNSLMALLSSRMRIVGGRNTGAEGYDSTLAQQTWPTQGILVDSTPGLNTAVNIETTCIVSKSPNDFAMTADPRAKPSHGGHPSDPDSKGSLDSYPTPLRSIPAREMV